MVSWPGQVWTISTAPDGAHGFSARPAVWKFIAARAIVLRWQDQGGLREQSISPAPSLVKAAGDAEHVAAPPGRVQASCRRSPGWGARPLPGTEKRNALGGREFGARAVVVDATDDHVGRVLPPLRLQLRRARRPAPVAAIGGRRALSESRPRAPLAQSSDDPGFASTACVSWTVWWQWTTGPRGVMTDFARTARPDVHVAGGQDLDVPMGPLAAYLNALEARVGALERRLSAVPLMTAADAAR